MSANEEVTPAEEGGEEKAGTPTEKAEEQEGES